MAMSTVAVRVTRLQCHDQCADQTERPLSKHNLRRVQEALQEARGVASVSQEGDGVFGVTAAAGGFVTIQGLRDAVASAGNFACEVHGVKEHLLQIRGLKNENDAKWIVQGLHSVKGVLHAAVSIETKVALVWVSEGHTISLSTLKEAIQGSSKSFGAVMESVAGMFKFTSPPTQDLNKSLEAEPQGGPHERELLLRIGSLNAGDVSAVVGPEMLRELEAVPGVVAVEPVIEQREEALGEEVRVEHLDPSKVIHEVKIFFKAKEPLSLERLQTAAAKGGARWSEVVGIRHALDGVRFGNIAEQIHGEVSQIVLTVRGLSSLRCAAVVKQSLENVSGVTGVSILGPEPSGTCPTEGGHVEGKEPEERKVLVSLSRGSTVTPDMLCDAVERWAPHCCGRVQPIVPGASQVLIALTGVDTKAKAQGLSAILADVPGVVFEAISIADQEALIIGQPSLELLLEAVQSAGFIGEVSEVVSKPLPKLEASAQVAKAIRVAKSVFRVGGMTCSACSGAVENALKAMPGVKAAQVNLLTEKATVEFDSSVVTSAAIAEEIDDIGYEAELQEEMDVDASSMASARLIIGGMSCASCAASVESVLQAMVGVESATVNFAVGKATVRFDTSEVGLRSLVEAVEAAGYKAEPESWDLSGSSATKSGLSEASKWGMLFWWALLCALPIASITMVLHHLHLPPVEIFLFREVYAGISIENVVCAALSTISQFGPPGLKFYRDSFHGMMRCAPNMALLVALGTTVSYLYGIYGLLLGFMSGEPSHWAGDYFEVAADLIAFITLGKWLEARAKGATSRVLHKLLELKPETAILLSVNAEGRVVEERVIPAEQLQVGDMLKVVRGASVPADGVVVVGTVEVDESMLTGESMPVTKTVNDALMGATVVREGTVFLRVTSTGKDTVLSQIVNMIEDAQASKPPIQAMADAISQVFVPVIVCFSLAVFSGWLIAANLDMVPAAWIGNRTPLAFALNMGIATMVVACPCAMGLAVPTAVMVGTGVAARNGVLIKEGEAIEHARKVTAIIFDKTGTLTQGKPEVTEVIPLTSKVSTPEVIRLTGAAETSSEHPLGRALVAFARLESEGFLGQPDEFVAESGKGLQCKVDGRHVIVGTKTWMKDMKVIGLTEDVYRAANQLESQAKTAVFVAIDLEVAALFGIADAPRPESAVVLRHLNAMGIETWMVTGDNRTTANSVAQKLGLAEDFVMAEVLPGNKARQVKFLQDKGHVVAMVGDGINDAPALAQADLGLAIGNGTDIAIEAAGMVLMGSQITGVVAAVEVSRAIHRRIWSNFCWALIYNLVLIPAAAGAAYPLIGATLPAWAAGAAMAMSSVSVVLSSLLLNLYRVPQPHGIESHDTESKAEKMKPGLQQVVVVPDEDSLTRPLLQAGSSDA